MAWRWLVYTFFFQPTNSCGDITHKNQKVFICWPLCEKLLKTTELRGEWLNLVVGKCVCPQNSNAICGYLAEEVGKGVGPGLVFAVPYCSVMKRICWLLESRLLFSFSVSRSLLCSRVSIHALITHFFLFLFMRLCAFFICSCIARKDAMNKKIKYLLQLWRLYSSKEAHY